MSTDQPPLADNLPDVRLYVTDPEAWQVVVKPDSDRMYCYQKHPGEDYFHVIASGEIYLIGGDEKLCLKCALRRGVVTQDRQHWQTRTARGVTPI